jgi:hypothetical protein
VFRVFVYPQELTDDLDGEYFGVAERGSGSTCSETPELNDAIVDEAEDRYDESAKIQQKTSATSGAIGLNTERREVFCLAQVLKGTCTRGQLTTSGQDPARVHDPPALLVAPTRVSGALTTVPQVPRAPRRQVSRVFLVCP